MQHTARKLLEMAVAVGVGSIGEARIRRRRAIAELIRSGRQTSQDELVFETRPRGFAVTQATVFRDLNQ